jgi:hypothetical protein
VAVIKPGRVLFEMGGVPEKLAKEAMRLAAHKLPIKTRFITRASQDGAGFAEAADTIIEAADVVTMVAEPEPLAIDTPEGGEES